MIFMSLIDTFAFESIANKQLIKVGNDRIGNGRGGGLQKLDVDCKIAWGSWSEWSECQGYGPGGDFYGKHKQRVGIIERSSLGNGKPCPTATDRNDVLIQAVIEGYAEGIEYRSQAGENYIIEHKLKACPRPEPEETEESEESEETDDVTEQGEEDGEADDTAEGEEEEEEDEEETVTTTTVTTSGQVSPQCPANSTFDEEEKMCKCDLGYTLDESTSQCNRNTVGFLLDAKWWILSAAGAGGAYLYHRSR
jgi:hypothetical protein